jgi:omega-amidase
MRVTIFQWDIRWMDISANLDKVGQVCHEISGSADLLVLPEMFNTGYTMDPTEVDNSFTSITINTLHQLSTFYNIHIVGTIPMYRDNKYYNTSILICPDGRQEMYDKVHLFKMAGEDKKYSPGLDSDIYMMNDWRLQLQICYDLRFPYLSYREQNKDIIIYSANWPVKRIHHWRQLLIARAIENQCYVIGVNRTGQDANGYIYNGQSIIVDFNGEVLTDLGEPDGYTTITIDREAMSQFRLSLPFLSDRILL